SRTRSRTSTRFPYTTLFRSGKELKALIPGGASTPVLRADQLKDVSMDANSLNQAGSMMGTAGMVVMNEDTDMIELLWRITHFFQDRKSTRLNSSHVSISYAV